MSGFRHASRILILRPHPWTLRAMLVEGGTRREASLPASGSAGEAGLPPRSGDPPADTAPPANA